MRALVYDGPSNMNIREVPVPELGPNEVLIHVKVAGICGSELSGYLGQNSLRVPPLIMGHEFSGVIEKLGIDVTSFKVGDRVTVNPLVSCGNCPRCWQGHANLCTSRVLIGAGRPGAYAEFVAVPEKNVVSLSDQVTFEQAALTEPLACAVRICRLAQASSLNNIFIAGAGPIGLFVLIVSRLFGQNMPIVMDINEERLEIVSALGGKPVRSEAELTTLTPYGGFDIAVDAVGLEVTRRQCIESVRLGGSVILSGLHTAESMLPINLCIRKELKILGSFAYSPDDFDIALRWITEGKVDLDAWVELRSIEEGQAAFEKLIGSPGKTAKILLNI